MIHEFRTSCHSVLAARGEPRPSLTRPRCEAGFQRDTESIQIIIDIFTSFRNEYVITDRRSDISELCSVIDSRFRGNDMEAILLRSAKLVRIIEK